MYCTRFVNIVRNELHLISQCLRVFGHEHGLEQLAALPVARRTHRHERDPPRWRRSDSGRLARRGCSLAMTGRLRLLEHEAVARAAPEEAALVGERELRRDLALDSVLYRTRTCNWRRIEKKS